MSNDAKFGLVVGVGLVIAIGVVFFHKEPPSTEPAPTAAPSAMRSTVEKNDNGVRVAADRNP